MRLSYLGTAVALSTACTSIQSSSIKTSGMSASMQVVADGTGQTTASATLNVGSNSTDFVDLRDFEHLRLDQTVQRHGAHWQRHLLPSEQRHHGHLR